MAIFPKIQEGDNGTSLFDVTWATLNIFNNNRYIITMEGNNSADGSSSSLGNSIFGVEGIDNKIGNSIKKGNLYMIGGKTGVGKTTTSLHFLVNGAKKGKKAQ